MDIMIRAALVKGQEGVVLRPLTASDKVLFNNFYEQSQNKYVDITLKNDRASKTYSQLKTAWALIDLTFQAINYRKPTGPERKQFGQEIVEELGPKVPSLLHEGEETSIPMSQMSKEQMSTFIRNLVYNLAENCDMSDAMLRNVELDVKNIFIEWQTYKSSLDKDPDDYDENGEMISIEEFRQRHPISFASGVGGVLELAHIVSRGADEIHRDCCWNTMMLTPEEHRKQHQVGWNEFLKIYPHLRGRVERARRIAGKLALLEAENGSVC